MAVIYSIYPAKKYEMNQALKWTKKSFSRHQSFFSCVQLEISAEKNYNIIFSNMQMYDSILDTQGLTVRSDSWCDGLNLLLEQVRVCGVTRG